ncbi:hypothetical protein Zmor_010234 [Zophobas morio]|uniref:Uncharacterized protein n=1 Tax=Zophobas morio TaxID=2755281 RepID=A0AA38IS62_9CUCU|nr:hypothetical protein Zmor_010234 [Zophobas morio]
MKVLASVIAVSCLFIVVICQTTTTISPPTTPASDGSNLNPDWSYCMEFTWVGPAYDNFTRFNRTCADYLDETRATGIPCSPPIVITEDGTPPDIDYLFRHHKTSVLCKRTPNQVCATYTYRFDGIVSNSTYMCTKVQEFGGGAITSGCYTQNIRGYDVEVCVCKSTKGHTYKPCNHKLVDYS